jgi:hypothetical protein
VLSESGKIWGHQFLSGVAEWLESRNVFMRAMTFSDSRDIPVGFLARTGQQLQQLDLFGCKNIANASFCAFTTRLPRLEDVSLYDCYQIEDKSLEHLADFCPRLHTVDLSLTSVSDYGLMRLGEGCRGLKKVNYSFGFNR